MWGETRRDVNNRLIEATDLGMAKEFQRFDRYLLSSDNANDGIYVNSAHLKINLY
jgi:hypothetical protein